MTQSDIKRYFARVDGHEYSVHVRPGSIAVCPAPDKQPFVTLTTTGPQADRFGSYRDGRTTLEIDFSFGSSNARYARCVLEGPGCSGDFDRPKGGSASVPFYTDWHFLLLALGDGGQDWLSHIFLLIAKFMPRAGFGHIEMLVEDENSEWHIANVDLHRVPMPTAKPKR